MIIQSKFKLARIVDRDTDTNYSDKNGLVSTYICQPCCKFLPEEFDSAGEADEYRSYKDFPEDYIIIQTW